jgi:hypothetical protein
MQYVCSLSHRVGETVRWILTDYKSMKKVFSEIVLKNFISRQQMGNDFFFRPFNKIVGRTLTGKCQSL